MLSSHHTTKQPSHSPGLRKRRTSGGSKIAYHPTLIPNTSSCDLPQSSDRFRQCHTELAHLVFGNRSGDTYEPATETRRGIVTGPYDKSDIQQRTNDLLGVVPRVNYIDREKIPRGRTHDGGETGYSVDRNLYSVLITSIGFDETRTPCCFGLVRGHSPSLGDPIATKPTDLVIGNPSHHLRMSNAGSDSQPGKTANLRQADVHHCAVVISNGGKMPVTGKVPIGRIVQQPYSPRRCELAK